jgi:cell division topological specificity factor
MRFIDYFFRRSANSANQAKNRLAIMIARDGSGRAPDYLPQLQQELLAVIARYEKIDLEHVTVNVDRAGGCEVLELNIVLPDGQKPRGPFKGGRPISATG